jgi:pimeloyl-ACP methyl ester carboxylesterase
VPFLEIPRSPLAPGLSPVRLHYRRHGHGTPLVFLHSGWGYGVYPFDRQQAAFEEDHEILAPDRSGYGGSPRLTRFAEPLHDAAAVETLLFMDALGLERASLWGHSDGAVIAALVGLRAPERVCALVLEAIHVDRRKPGSRVFFEELREPERADPRLAAMLAADHGEDYWREVWRMEGEAWLRILDTADDPSRDLYHGRLGELAVPVLVVHGERDPRTEPGELDELARLLPRAEISLLPEGGHCPHHERATTETCAGVVRKFLDRVGRRGPRPGRTRPGSGGG